jgi:Domain of unknown function (DUF4126)
MSFTPSTIAGLVIAASFAAGLNVYATVLTLGILARVHWVELPSGLEVLANGWVIGASAAMFSIEFFADKVPAFDLIWNALHTFVRIPLAALLAYRATLQLSPEMQLLATVGGALIAMAAHSSKTAARTLITPSPEPISNIALSTGEDAVAVGLTWTATHHPWFAGSIAAGLTIAAILTAHWISRAVSKAWKKLLGPRQIPA